MNAKVPFLCAALLAGSALFTPTFANAAVESPIVGYQTISMEAGKWYQIGTPFVALDNATEQKLNDVYNVGFANGDTVSVFNPATAAYSVYTWKNEGTDTAGWCTSRGATPVETMVPVGNSIFVNKKTAGDVVVRGRVDVTAAITIGDVAGNAWDQITPLVPAARGLNELKWEGMQNGDTVSVFDPDVGGYSIYTWKNAGTATAGWCTSRGTIPVAVTLSSAQSLFVNKKSAGLATISAE